MEPLKAFAGDPQCLHWNLWDQQALKAAVDLTPGRKLVVQAGGNLGLFAHVLSGAFEAVYTFEPDPTLFPLMVANAPEPNIIRFQAALGSAPGTTGIAVPDAPHHAGEAFVSGEGIVPVMTLDSLRLPACDLLYLDIEGSELNALKGASWTIQTHRPVIAVEMNKCCERYGYTPHTLTAHIIAHGYRKAAHVHADHMFVPC